MDDTPQNHHPTQGIRDMIAYRLVRGALLSANVFFGERYGHRAIVLETIAAIPGMVGGLFQHLKALRKIRDDQGWIQTLLSEASNERMHLMVFVHVANPTKIERLLIAIAQFMFFNSYFLMYLFSSYTAHRFTGYLEEEAVRSYTHYLTHLEKHPEENIPAPQIAIDYWKLPSDARLREVIIATRKDEVNHRDTNHRFATESDSW